MADTNLFFPGTGVFTQSVTRPEFDGSTFTEAIPEPYATVYKRFAGWQCQTELVLKRVVDIVGSLFGILLLAPMFLVIAAAIALTSPGPVIYKSLRHGKNNELFHMYKFRTMFINAEQLRAKLEAENNLTGQLFKLKDDPRITPVGKFLRKFSLDEFPQLFNVLKGEMSLVGPRPYIPEETRMFRPPYTLRFEVLPGMTGLWQVSGRSNIPFDKMCEMELGYVSQWRLWDDICILFRTVPAVILQRGAY